ncbi:MAG: YbaB/EbfC family nucleoid-associated protein [Patescibacteria group bacterium]
MFNKIKAIKDLRDKAKTMQSALGEIHVEGSAAWGKIKVTMNGNQEVENLSIDQEMMSDKAKLETSVKDAVNDTMKKLQKELAGKMKEMGGMDMFKDLGLGG